MSRYHVMEWRLIIEEYDPMIFYVPDLSNVIVDALNRLPTLDKIPTENVF